MKKILTIIFILMTFTYPIFSQWRVMNPHPTPNALYVGSAPSADRFFTVTPQSEAVFTHDGGQTWKVVQIGGNGIYRSCYFLNDNLGWAAGAFVERLHKTTDGGLTWTWLSNAPDTTKYDIFFIDQNIGWSVGFNGFIIKTTDGGDNWFSQTNTSVTSRTLYGVYSTDANNVYVVGSSDAVLKSSDGGNTWNLIPMIYGTTTDYRGVYFPPTGSGQIGFIVGHRNRIAKTTNAGATWSSVYDGGTTNQLWSVDFDDSFVNGLACGALSTVLRTTNSGNTWSAVGGFPAGITFYSVRFGSDNAVYLSGNNGYLFKSTDGGATWNELGYRFTTSSLKDVSFADTLNGYVVGTNFVARTTNGGLTWMQQTSPFSGDINEVVATSSDHAVAGCDGGNVIVTTNGGNNWNLVATGITGTNSDILAIDFINDNFGIAAAYNGTVAKTTDGGFNWTIVSAISGFNPWDMDMVDSLYGWVAGTGERIVRTTDGGLTWQQQLSVGGIGTYGISFIDRQRGIAGGTGGNTYYTTNGGVNWLSATTPPGNTVWGIHFVESPVLGSIGMTACASGYVYISTDGGANWTLEPRYTISTFSDIFMTDAAHAWIVGNSGVILKYDQPANVPVELLSFSSFVVDDDVTLNWSTATETNNAGFQIERSKKLEVRSEEWNSIGFVNGSGTTTKIKSYSYKDENLAAGKYLYRLKQIDLDGTFEYSNIIEAEVLSPSEFILEQNYPNPFNPNTRIQYAIGSKQFVSLKIFNSLGEEVASLVNEEKSAGFYKIDFNASHLSSGIYYYKIIAGDFVQTRKMILIK
ncbi:MAG TPA: YCF48-related protein [Ignavibacteriaceae bacterium]|nr:YCF48-related protein [Ignavibacteriaceae bacterium]